MSVPARGGHPAPEELGLLLEDAGAAGPGSGDRQRRATAGHVAGCDRCTATLEEMAWVRRLLRAEASRTPPPPADLGARLSAALEAERRTGSGPQAGAAIVPGRRRPAGVPRWLAVAAGLVVLGGTATAATQLLGGGDQAATVSGTAGAGADVREEAAAEAAPEAGAADGTAVLRTGEDYTAQHLEEQVRGLLGAAGSPRAARLGELQPDQPALQDRGTATLEAPRSAGEDAAAAPSGGEQLWAPEALAGCLEAIGEPGAVPQAVDLATFDGRDVAVIVLGEDAERSRVWVVEPDCRPGDDGLVHYQIVTR